MDVIFNMDYVDKMQNIQLPPIMQPLQAMPLDECEQLWNDLKSKLRALMNPINAQQHADIKSQARQLYRDYIQCMREKRPGHIRKHLSTVQEAAIDYVAAGGSRRSRRTRRNTRRNRSLRNWSK